MQVIWPAASTVTNGVTTLSLSRWICQNYLTPFIYSLLISPVAHEIWGKAKQRPPTSYWDGNASVGRGLKGISHFPCKLTIRYCIVQSGRSPMKSRSMLSVIGIDEVYEKIGITFALNPSGFYQSGWWSFYRAAVGTNHDCSLAPIRCIFQAHSHVGAWKPGLVFFAGPQLKLCEFTGSNDIATGCQTWCWAH